PVVGQARLEDVCCGEVVPLELAGAVPVARTKIDFPAGSPARPWRLDEHVARRAIPPRPWIGAELVVGADLEDMRVLRNVGRCRRSRRRLAIDIRRNDEACWRRDGLIAKTIIVVFELQRPSGCHCMLDAGTDGPAPAAVMQGCRSGLRKVAGEFIVRVD